MVLIYVATIIFCYVIYTAIQYYNKQHYNRLALEYQQRQRKFLKKPIKQPKTTELTPQQGFQSPSTYRRDSTFSPSSVSSPIRTQTLPLESIVKSRHEPRFLEPPIQTHDTPVPVKQTQRISNLPQYEQEQPILPSKPIEPLRVEQLKSHKPIVSSPLAGNTTSDDILKRKKTKPRLKKKKVSTPSSVRKSAVPVESRKKMFEDISNEKSGAISIDTLKPIDQTILQEVNEDDSKRKRKYDEELKPEDGFTWIDYDTIKLKKVKLNQENIVKKRLEYFKSLGVQIPQQTVPIPVHRVRLRTDESSTARIGLKNITKSGVTTPLRKKLDDDELDEMTMKRLAGSTKESPLGNITAANGLDSTPTPFKFTVPESKKSEEVTSSLASIEKNQNELSKKTEIPSISSETPTHVEKKSLFNLETQVLTPVNADEKKKEPTLLFGQPKDASQDKKVAPLFSFPSAGVAKEEVKPAISFNFGSSATTLAAATVDSKKTEDLKPAPVPLFGQPSTNHSVPKIAEKKPEFSFGISTGLPTSEAEKPKVVESQPEPPKFQFGLPEVKKPVETKPAIVPGFSFSTPTEKKDDVQKQAPAFSFGAAATATDSKPAVTFGTLDASKPISFGTLTTTAPASDVKPVTAPSFSFGQPSPNVAPTAVSSIPSFGQTPIATSSATSFVQPTSSTNLSASTGFGKQAPVPTAGFGQPLTSNGFGQSTSTTPSAAPLFGQTAVPTSTSTFGQVAPTSTSTFGQVASTTTAFGQPSSNTTTAFGQSAPAPTTTAFGQTNSTSGTGFGTTSTFGQPSTTPTNTFGQPSTATSFGATSVPQPAPTPTNTFGQPSTATSFGATSVPQPAPTSINTFGQPSTATSFGSTSVPQPAPTPINTFGQPSTTTSFGSTPAPSFGQSNTVTAFGQPGSTPTTNSFGQATPSSNSGFTFGSNVMNNNPPSSFGTQPISTGFGTSTTTTTPAFGSNAASFGGNATPGSSFGQTIGNAPSFQFGANQASTPSFGQPNQPPASSFGQSNTQSSFNAPAPAPQSQFQFSGSAPAFQAPGGQFQFSAGGIQAPAFNAPAPSSGRAIVTPKSRRGGPKRR